MKKVIIENDKVFVCEEIVANGKQTDFSEFALSTADLIQAVEQRIDNCVSKLQEAYNKQEVYGVNNISIWYKDEVFNISSYEALDKTLKFLRYQKNQNREFIKSDKLRELSNLQLNQLKKAYVAYMKDWTIGASFIESAELDKFIKETKL